MYSSSIDLKQAQTTKYPASCLYSIAAKGRSWRDLNIEILPLLPWIKTHTRYIHRREEITQKVIFNIHAGGAQALVAQTVIHLLWSLRYFAYLRLHK